MDSLDRIIVRRLWTIANSVELSVVGPVSDQLSAFPRDFLRPMAGLIGRSLFPYLDRRCKVERLSATEVADFRYLAALLFHHMVRVYF